MYVAMRERARCSSQLAGLASAIFATSAVGYALANGFMGQVAKLIETPMTFMPLAAASEPVADDPAAFSVDTTRLAPPLPIPPFAPVEFTEDEGAGVLPEPWRDPARGDVGRAGGDGTGRMASPVRTRPVLLTRAPPPYPAGEIRRRATGTTALEVCIDAKGGVTSASVASVSGHPGLDAAALKWIRTARFTPARSDGIAEATCGHEVVYEWNLSDAH